MLELKLVKESPFPKVLEAILDLVDVASVDCSSKGLKLQAVDPEHIAIIMLLFPAENFQYYSCDEYLTMGIAIDDMVTAIRCADEDHTITIKIGDENFDTITLSFESPRKCRHEKNTATYDMRVVDANIQRFPVPDWEAIESKYQAFVEMPSAEFVAACKCLSNVGGAGDISVTDKGLEFYASGERMRVSFKCREPKVTMLAPVSMTLNLKYMNSYAKASSVFQQVKICLSTDHPLMVECEIGVTGFIRYFVVPNVKSDIEDKEIKESKKKMLKIDGKDEEVEIKERKSLKRNRDSKDKVSADEKEGVAEELVQRGSMK